MRNLVSLQKTTVALAVMQALAFNPSSAATITVNNASDSTAGCTFRQAIEIINTGSDQSNGCFLNTSNDSLGSNDTILFDNSITRVSLTTGQVTINSDVSINGGSKGVTLSGNNSSRLLGIYASNVLISNMTLTNGSSNLNGGAIHALQSDITLSNSTISTNSATSGGGIHAEGSNVTLNNSAVLNLSLIHI